MLDHLIQSIRLLHTGHQVALFVVVRAEDKEDNHVAEHICCTRFVPPDRRGAVDLSVIFADIQMLALVQAIPDHEVVVTQFEVLISAKKKQWEGSEE